MSIEHRNNPDSEECQRMDYENRRDVWTAKQMAKRMPERRMKHYCNDRTCGGEDCLTCYPGNRDIDLEDQP